MKNLETLKRWVEESERIVFFGGAGVSTESGIPDFRSVDGLYNQKFEYPPERIISHSFYLADPACFFRFYREKMMPLGFEPNVTHHKLAQWEQEGKLLGVVTQNIDGLHQKAGSKNVFEIHGSALRNYCMRCGKKYPSDYIFISDFKQDASPMKIKYGCQATPTCFLTDKNHQIVVKSEGLDMDEFNKHLDVQK